MIDPRRLAVLREVARHGSFNQAAVALRLTPSAVSQQVSALERTLGTAVVERSTRGVQLTEAGGILVGAGEVIAAELACAESEVARLVTSGTEELTVATFTSAGQGLLPAALLPFTARYPGVELTVLEAEPEESLPLVRAGAADIALAFHFDGPPPVVPGDRSGLTWTPLVDDPMWIVLPAGHRFAGRESVGLAELAGERWIHGCLSNVELLDLYSAATGFELRTACRSTDYVFAQSLVRAGVGISMIPQVALVPDRRGLAYVRLASPCPCRFIGTVTASRRPRALAVALRTALQDLVAAEPIGAGRAAAPT
jgi:molybdate transport repressor ModE-like protein